ncbi:MAG: Mth938-like domain-containing protein [Betaproteobacteria bacterium]|nr:Mth938-like domain-containing protein [Betaproteobacteria bacterium]
MKLEWDRIEGKNAFTGYGQNYVEINGKRHESGLLVLSGQIIEGWGLAGFEALQVEDFEQLAALAPDIALFGSGPTLRFPAPELLRPLIEAGIGLEVMNTPAACRTWNILVSEGRKVVAALLMI